MSTELNKLASALASAGVEHSYVKSAPAVSDMSALSQALASAGLKHMVVGANPVIASGAGKRISISYETWDEESEDAGETDEKGWENEEGIEFTDDADETAVEQAIDFLKKEGATNFSASSFEPRGWYSTGSESDDRDIQTGELTIYSYHLNGEWTDEEKEAIYNGVTGKADHSSDVAPGGLDLDATASTEVVAFGYTTLNDAVLTKIDAGRPFKINAKPANRNKGSVHGSPELEGHGWAEGAAAEAIEKLKEAGADYWIYSYNTPIFARLGSQWYEIPGRYTKTTTMHQGGIRRQLNAVEFGAERLPGAGIRRPVAPGGLDLDAEASTNLGALSHALASAGVQHTVVTAFEPAAPISVVISSNGIEKKLTITPTRYAADYNVNQLVSTIQSWSNKYLGPTEATASTEVVAFFGNKEEPVFITVKSPEKSVTFKYVKSPHDPSPTTIRTFFQALSTVGTFYKGTQLVEVPAPTDDDKSFFITIKNGAKAVTYKYVQSPYDPEPKTIKTFAQALEKVGSRYKGSKFAEVPSAEATASTEVIAFGTSNLPQAFLDKIAQRKDFKVRNGSVSGHANYWGPGRADGKALTTIKKLQALEADYWLYSYATPIGALVGDQWYIIPGQYSPTTTRHQHILWQLGAKSLDDTALPADVRRPVAPGGLDLD